MKKRNPALCVIFSIITFGIYGCWVMGEDGNLDYVKEEDYTDELWNEQKKAGLRSMGHMR